jgi:rfaE bifunctional protein kinase chain/domain
MKRLQKRKLTQIINSFEGKNVVVFGDVMLDHFIRGRVERISPEAPVPVLKVTGETFLPGAAGNVAVNLAGLGAKVTLVSVAGKDTAAGRLLKTLSDKGVDTSKIAIDKKRPTTEKVRIIAEHQQAIRFDRENSDPLAISICLQCRNNLKSLIDKARVVVLSDYGKGVLSHRNIEKVISLCNRRKVPLTVDPEIENFTKYRGVTCITPNTAEAWQGMRYHPKNPHDQNAIEELGKKILKKLKLKSVLITQGPNGMTLFEKANRINVTHIETVAKEVYDVTGAGDTVIAVLSLALACGAGLKQSAILSNYAAGIVVGKLGTATVTKRELIESLK